LNRRQGGNGHVLADSRAHERPLLTPKADIIATCAGRAVYGWSRTELSLARADSAMLVDPAGASRENSRRDGSLTCPGPRLCLGASHLYAGGCSDARARRHLGDRTRSFHRHTLGPCLNLNAENGQRGRPVNAGDNPTPIGTTPRYDDDCVSLAISLAGVVAGIQVFDA
jgi:hypothetical protein